MLDNQLILFDTQRTRTVDEHRPLGGSVDTVNGTDDEFLLKIATQMNVRHRLGHLDARITRNNTQSRARSITQDSVKASNHMRKLTTIQVAHNGVGDAHAMQVG